MTRIVCLLGALIVSAPVLAAKQNARAEASKPQRFDFDDDEVTAGVSLPQGEVVGARTAIGFESLIRVRTTFVPELVKSAQDR
jgi:hypothetical protein